MRYMMLVYIDESDDRGPAEVAPWAAEQDARGVRQIGSRLRPSSETKTVALRGGEVLVSDGPFAETKEQIGGFDILECRDLEEAIEIAASHPGARTGKVELRPLWEDPKA
jgi:hypothetical protein